MGTCMSKKKRLSEAVAALSPAKTADTKARQLQLGRDTKSKTENKAEQLGKEEIRAENEQKNGSPKKKEIFLIKHRKSHDGRDRSDSSKSPSQQQQSDELTAVSDPGAAEAPAVVGVGVRTSSCTKEEVDAILIQCGRLSRSSSGKAATSHSARRYSGSKRSYDFDHGDRPAYEDDDGDGNDGKTRKNLNSGENNGDGVEDDRRRQNRPRQRQSSRRSPSQGRRRTPSRERDHQNHQSGGRERRVSRSPGRRSVDAAPTPSNSNGNGNSNAAINNASSSGRPGKLVSVPATVSSLAMDKSNNGAAGADSATAATVKRISVKRNVEEPPAVVASRIASSPRSKSPARMHAGGKVSNENQQQQHASLSRSSSRKAEQSPCRRNPLSEIDHNQQPQSNGISNRLQNRKKKETEGDGMVKESHGVLQATKFESNNNKGVVCQTNNSRGPVDKIVVNQQKMADRLEQSVITVTPVPASEEENHKPQALTRSRSARRSRELDINPETLLNPAPSYTRLLLEDIQNFHHKTNSVTLPPCVTKACAILGAVADLNSGTSSNLSGAEDRRSPSPYQANRSDCNSSFAGSLIEKGVSGMRIPFVESEIAVDDDVMEPSFHKYVTVRRGTDMEDQESTGSNSYVGGFGVQHRGLSSSSWEPNSADSTDRWGSTNDSREDFHSGRYTEESRKKRTDRNSEPQRSAGIGRGRLADSGKGLHTSAVTAAAAST